MSQLDKPFQTYLLYVSLQMVLAHRNKDRFKDRKIVQSPLPILHDSFFLFPQSADNSGIRIFRILDASQKVEDDLLYGSLHFYSCNITTRLI